MEENIMTFTNIINPKELSYKYDGKTYLKYPVMHSDNGFSLTDGELKGFIVVSKRLIRSSVKSLYKASSKSVKQYSDNLVNNYIEKINLYN